MLKNDYTAQILDLEDVIVKKVENNLDALHIYLELPVTKQICPICGHETSYIHDYRNQVVKDFPLGRTTYIHLRKRRYVCPHCAKRFYEKNYFLGRYRRTTTRLVAAVTFVD